MNIEIKRYSDVTVIEGDDAKFHEMVNIHGASNVRNLDAVVEEAADPVADPQQVVDENVVKAAITSPVGVVLSSEPADMGGVQAPVDQPVTQPQAT